MEIKIPLAKPHFDGIELQEMERVMNSGCCAGTCGEVKTFENEFAQYVGSKHAIAVNSCTTGLHLACLTVGIKQFNNALIPAYTHPATGYAPMYCTPNIKIIDVNLNNWNINLDRLYNSKPDLVIPVHCFGNPCDMSYVKDIATDTNMTIIEDSACGVASTLNGKHTGTFGDVGVYSFYPIKEMCTGEGGMVVTDNEEYADKIRSLASFGKAKTQTDQPFEYIGYNYRLSAIQAAMGRVQLSKLDKMHKMRYNIAKAYDSMILSELFNDVLTQYSIPHRATPSYQRYSIALNKDINRNKVMSLLAKDGIQTSIGTFDLSHMKIFNNKSIAPNSNFLYKQSISLPMYPELDISNVEYIVHKLKKAIVIAK